MRKLITIGVAIGITLAMTSIAGAVATSNSKAVLDWSTFSYSYTGTDLDWCDASSVSSAGAADKNSSAVEHYDFSSDWGNTSATASVPNAWGNAWTTTGEVGEEAYADTTGQGLFWAHSYAAAVRYTGGFEVVGDGTLTVSIQYRLEQSLTTETIGDFAAGILFAAIRADNNNSGNSDVVGDELMYVVADGDSFSDSRYGTLTASLEFSDGDTGYVSGLAVGEAYVESIPAPGAFLLGSIDKRHVDGIMIFFL